MSLSNPKPKNPCKKFIEFKGNSGIFQYYDKASEKNIELEKPITFIVLDELSTITGFSDEYQCGIYSNEVHNLKDEVLNVRTFKGPIKIVGKYADIKADITSIGGKFCKSVYAALVDENLELVNFQLKGIAFKAWMDLSIDKQSFGVHVKDCSDGKKGSIKYKIPNFEQVDVSKALLDKAILMDHDLQAYLKEYSQSQVIKDESIQQHPKVEDQDDIPF